MWDDKKMEPLKHITNIESGSDKPLVPGEIKVKSEYITFDDLEKIDIRICRVLSATDILKNPKKEAGPENPVKAYHLKIDTGTEERDAVTNVVDLFSKEELVGMDIPFILNLEPTMIRGVLSKAMIVLAGGNKLLLGGVVGGSVLK